MLTLSTLSIMVMLSPSTYHIGDKDVLPPRARGSAVIATHLSAALAALIIGAAVLLREKGTHAHKLLGRAWVATMLVVAVSSFWIRRDGFSWIHLLSIWTLFSLACAVWFIRRGNVPAHRGFMVGTFLGLAGAGIGALAPGRLLYRFFLSA